MKSFLCRWWFAVCAVMILSSATFAEDTAALAKRLHNAAESSSIDDPSLKPWHLKLKIQLYDVKGNPSEQGTIEEWWSPAAYKRIYAMPSYTANEISSGKSVYRTKVLPPTPYLLDAALKLVEHPMMPSEAIDKSDLKMEVQSFGKVKLDCILLSKSGGPSITALPGKVPTSCLDPDVDQLRVSWFEPEAAFRTVIGLFQGRHIGVDTYVSLYGVKAVSGHVEILESKSFDSSVFTPGADLEDRSDDPVWVTAGATTNSSIHKVSPVYPEDAKRNHVAGAVMLIATIGADGRITQTEVVGTPNRSLAESATTAVKQWVYTPYLMNGVATKIRTTITVHYNSGGG